MEKKRILPIRINFLFFRQTKSRGKAFGKSQRKNIQQRCADPAAWWDYRENCKQPDPVSGEQCASIADTYDIRRNLGI